MVFFSVFRGTKNVKFFLKSHKKKLIFFKFLKKQFGGKNRIFLGLLKLSNLNALHKGLLLQDWVFRLDMNAKDRLCSAIRRNSSKRVETCQKYCRAVHIIDWAYRS